MQSSLKPLLLLLSAVMVNAAPLAMPCSTCGTGFGGGSTTATIGLSANVDGMLSAAGTIAGRVAGAALVGAQAVGNAALAAGASVVAGLGAMVDAGLDVGLVASVST